MQLHHLIKTMKPVLSICLVLCLTVVGLAGCTAQPTQTSQTAEGASGSSSQESGAYTFVDDLGYEVTIDTPSRVVACMGSFANIWELAGGTLVGASDDTFEDYPLVSKEVQNIGGFQALNLEQIISLEPDFVIMTGVSTGRDGAVSQTDYRESLEASGIPVAYFNVTVFDDYLRMLRVCTDITGRADLYETNGLAVQNRIEALLSQQAANADQKRVLLMTTYSGGTRVQDSQTMTGSMLSDIGVTNLADEFPSLLRDFSFEALVEANPDVILIVPMGNDMEAAQRNLDEITQNNPAWSELDAVSNNDFFLLEPELFLYKPNAQWDLSYQRLIDILGSVG